LIAALRDKQTIQVCEACSGRLLAALQAPDAGRIAALRFSPDSTQLAALEANAQVQLWDLRLIRQQLKQMQLDWDLPSYPGPDASSSAAPLTLETDSHP